MGTDPPTPPKGRCAPKTECPRSVTGYMKLVEPGGGSTPTPGCQLAYIDECLGLRAPPPGLSRTTLVGHKGHRHFLARATVVSYGGRDGEMQSTYARALHTDLLYQFRRPGVAERASWPSPPAEHPASLSTADQDVHLTSSPRPSPLTSDHARLPSAPEGAPLNRVRLATEQHDVIASV